MSSKISDADLRRFIGYFEIPEPGVPDGYTGWYHTAGKFPLRSAQQVFTSGDGKGNGNGDRSLVREDIAGPFSSRDQAAADLARRLGR